MPVTVLLPLRLVRAEGDGIKRGLSSRGPSPLRRHPITGPQPRVTDLTCQDQYVTIAAGFSHSVVRRQGRLVRPPLRPCHGFHVCVQMVQQSCLCPLAHSSTNRR